MQYDRSDAFLTAAFRTIQSYDPDTYARMVKDRWHVSADGVIGEIMGAFGVTNPGETDIDPDMIQAWALDHGVKPVNFAATVLVHEYAHNHQNGRDSVSHEVPAFQAGSAFAAKIPGHDGRVIKALSDYTLRETRRHGANLGRF